MPARAKAYPVLAFIGAVLAAILSPTPDAISMLILWLIITVVLCVLFEFGSFFFGRS
jgi:hypothetical protein